MKNIKGIIITLLGIVTFFVLCLATQEILTKKYFDDGTDIVNGFYCEKENDIDVLVLGSSHAICGINPLVMYREEGIAAYDFGASWQSLQITSYWLEEALKTQNPKLVVLECSQIYDVDPEIQMNEMLLSIPYIRFSKEKVHFLCEAAGGLNRNFVSYLFPIFEFKGRWKELSRTDFTYTFVDKCDYSKGYYFTEIVCETPVNLSGYSTAEEMEIPEKNKVYLDQIVRTCKEENIELLLVITPQRDWTSSQTVAMQQYADINQITYIDYMELEEEIELDIEKDFRDEWHLNNFGSEKLSKHLGRYIRKNCELPDRREDSVHNSWDFSVNKWEMGNDMNRDVY